MLFFRLAALSPGCTAQTCRFRDLAAESAAVGAQPVGISGDTVERRAESTGRHTPGVPLLSDADGEVRERFGVRRAICLAPTGRATFVVGQDRTVLEVVRSEPRRNAHADRALAALRDHRARDRGARGHRARGPRGARPRLIRRGDGPMLDGWRTPRPRWSSTTAAS